MRVIGFHVGVRVDQRQGHRGVAVLGRPVQRGHAVAFRDVHVGAWRDELLHRGRVAILRGVGDRRRMGRRHRERDLAACVLLLRECLCARREQQRRTEQADSFHSASSSDAECELARAVAEALHVVEPSLCRSVSNTFAIGVPSGALRCMSPARRAVPVSEQQERAAAVVVEVAVGHRRAVHDHRLVEQVLVAVHRVLRACRGSTAACSRGTG